MPAPQPEAATPAPDLATAATSSSVIGDANASPRIAACGTTTQHAQPQMHSPPIPSKRIDGSHSITPRSSSQECMSSLSSHSSGSYRSRDGTKISKSSFEARGNTTLTKPGPDVSTLCTTGGTRVLATWPVAG